MDHLAEMLEGRRDPFLGRLPWGAHWVDDTTQRAHREKGGDGQPKQEGAQHRGRKRSKEQVLKLKKVLRVTQTENHVTSYAVEGRHVALPFLGKENKVTDT